jgi:hypothetical protein
VAYEAFRDTDISYKVYAVHEDGSVTGPYRRARYD